MPTSEAGKEIAAVEKWNGWGDAAGAVRMGSARSAVAQRHLPQLLPPTAASTIYTK